MTKIYLSKTYIVENVLLGGLYDLDLLEKVTINSSEHDRDFL